MAQNQTNIVTARQPILNHKMEVFGYEFFYRSSTKDSTSTIRHTAESDTSTIINLFSNFNLDRLLAGKKASLNCVLEHDESINSFEMLNKENVILEVQEPSDQKNKNIIENIYQKMLILKQKGFTIAGSEIVFDDKYKKWFEVVDMVKFKSINYDLQNNLSLEKLSKYVKICKSSNKTIVMEMVESQNQFDLYKKFYFDYYQGFFFSKPINLASKITNPSLEVMIKLINLVNSDADFTELESVIKRDPTISFKLLRYLNAVGVGEGEKITNIKRALTILGSKKLLKWVTILFSSIKAKNGLDEVAKTALIRARLMELLAQEIGEKDVDSYFITGLFSLLDAMLDVDLEVSLNSIDVSQDIKDSVLRNTGKFSKMLNLVKYIEEGEWIDIFASLYVFNIKNEVLSEKYLEAIEWTEKLDFAQEDIEEVID